MSYVPTKAVLAACALACLPALAAAEDLTIVSRVTSAGKPAPATTTQYLASDKVRTSDGDNDSILDLATGKMTVIDHKKKEYYEFTREDMDAAMKKMEEAMKAAPAIMSKMMGGPAGEVTVQKTGAPRTVAGYSCDPYVVSMGENLKYEICATTAIQPPAQYFDALKARYSMMGPMAGRFQKLFEEMRKVKGFPIAMNTSITMMGFKQETRSEATEIKRGPIPASAFAVPAGYARKESPFKRMG